MTTPEPLTSAGFSLFHGRTGLGSRSTLVILTIESSGSAAGAAGVAPAIASIARPKLKPTCRIFIGVTSLPWGCLRIGSPPPLDRCYAAMRETLQLTRPAAADIAGNRPANRSAYGPGDLMRRVGYRTASKSVSDVVT